jgi:hypothetical protein
LHLRNSLAANPVLASAWDNLGAPEREYTTRLPLPALIITQRRLGMLPANCQHGRDVSSVFEEQIHV